MASVEKALRLLKSLPRVTLGNLKPLPGTRSQKTHRRGQHGGRKCGRGNNPMKLPRIGFEGGNVPFYLSMPMEPYYRDHGLRKQYPPLSLLQLQRLVDLGRIDTSEPIDLTSICNTKVVTVKPMLGKHFGINLTDEGADIFCAKVNIEVQWTNELTIAAIEKNGGTIITKFYDFKCLDAMVDPELFFKRGNPIPRCRLPSPDVLEYYSDPYNRGYLADPELIQQARVELSQKLGYTLPDISQDPQYEMLTRRKDPRQIWYGLSPGWLVNTKHKTVLVPRDKEYTEFYQS